ncbi:MAG: Mor transcription activator family protein, partial [Porcipelethomonas sp.]
IKNGKVTIYKKAKPAHKIHKLFGGQQISFPKKLYCSDYINSCIQGSYNGRNIRELAQRFGISERRVRQILRKPK